jgi:hypothetical protein
VGEMKKIMWKYIAREIMQITDIKTGKSIGSGINLQQFDVLESKIVNILKRSFNEKN